MQFTPQQFTGEMDLRRMHSLSLTHPKGSLHTIDLRYRFSSPALYDDPQENACLWEDEEGNLAGWAVWQQPFVTLDYAYHPLRRSDGIEGIILEWGIKRFEEIAAARGEQYFYWIAANRTDRERIALLERNGFTSTDSYFLHLLRPLNTHIPKPILPDGFTLRPLAGDAEVPQYVAVHRAAFGSENMTEEWRKRTLAAPGYVPGLDLVIEAPDGRLAAVCIGWLGMDGHEGMVEPLAVHPDFQHMGLGRAILLDLFRRLREAGANTVHVEVESDNAEAVSLYKDVGFRPGYPVMFYGREF